jgi:hypothetical protein
MERKPVSSYYVGPEGAERTLQDIHLELDGQEWNSDTLEKLGVIIEAADFKIRSPDEMPECCAGCAFSLENCVCDEGK